MRLRTCSYPPDINRFRSHSGIVVLWPGMKNLKSTAHFIMYGQNSYIEPSLQNKDDNIHKSKAPKLEAWSKEQLL